MKSIVSITSRGQVSLPRQLLKEFGIVGHSKAYVRKVGKSIVVEPRKGFVSLSGSLRSRVRLTDAALKKARRSFSKDWPRR